MMIRTASCSRRATLPIFILLAILSASSYVNAQALGDPPDVSQDFQKMENVYFVGSNLKDFNPATGQGTLQWDRYLRNTTLSFNKIDIGFGRGKATEFPGTEYDQDPALPFSLTFVSPRTVRLRMSTRAVPLGDGSSLMLAGPVPSDNSWKVEQNDKTISYKSAYGEVRITRQPWHVAFYDKSGHLLTRTQNIGDPATFITPVPFSFVRRTSDLSRRIAATFLLQHDEKIFGCGESFTRLDKRGQHVNVYTRDGMGTQNELMYKPIPFFLSSNGYGMFVHTSAPVTFDFGKFYDAHNVIYSGDENLDLFIFLGEPKDILSEYTALTGRSPVPPLWSFGFWMSRITYNSEEQVRNVAAQLRAHKVPTDVIHLDTGWFETDWRSDYKFSASRFRDPAKMLADLKQQGFHISLWQYTYFTSKNDLWKEMVANGYFVRNEGGKLPFEDATLDVSNPAAVKWYQGKLASLLKMGVGAIKSGLGEGAPLTDNMLREKPAGTNTILSPTLQQGCRRNHQRGHRRQCHLGAQCRAGSQRYPLHWGGDAENTDWPWPASCGRFVIRIVRLHLLSHDRAGCAESAADLYLALAGMGRAHFAYASSRRAAARTVGVRRSFD